MNARQVFLLIAGIGLVPIALAYGVVPQKSLGYCLDISLSNTNSIHIFRAAMGLYLALSLFWILAAFKVHLRQAALYSLIVFMLGLAAGRILSLLIDGIPHWLLLVYLVLELGFGAVGLVLANKSD
ncbi:MAG: DUF4345 domain-containing protein [Bacteroidota bacterium]